MPAEPPEHQAALASEENKRRITTLLPSPSAGKSGRGRGNAKPSVPKSASQHARTTRSLDRTGPEFSPLETPPSWGNSSQTKAMSSSGPSINLKDLEELDLSSLDSGPGQSGTSSGALRSFSTTSVQPNQNAVGVAGGGRESKASRNILPPPASNSVGQFSGKNPVASPIVVGDKKTATGKASPARIASNSNLNDSGESSKAAQYLMQAVCIFFCPLMRFALRELIAGNR